MGYIIGAVILWMIVRSFRRAVATAKVASDLEQQHSPTASHTTTIQRTPQTHLGADDGRRDASLSNHKGPFL